jgi:hypothetical protein
MVGVHALSNYCARKVNFQLDNSRKAVGRMMQLIDASSFRENIGGTGAVLTDHEPGIPGGGTPPSTAGETPAATEAWLLWRGRPKGAEWDSPGP